MKKFTALTLALILALSVFALGASADSKPVAEVKKGTPVIDGNIDEIWQYAEQLTLDRPGSDNLAPATGWAKLLWDDENLYIIAVITDTTKSSQTEALHLEDCLEIFFDLNNLKTDSYSETNQFRFLYDGVTPLTTGIRNPDNISGDALDHIALAFSEPDAATYVYEARINYKAGVDFAFKAGTEIGIDIGYDDNTEDDSVRTGSLFWNAEDNVSGIPSAMGTIRLVDVQAMPEPEPEPEPAPESAAAGGGSEAPEQPVVTAQAAPAAPKTGDNAVVVFAVLTLCAFAATRFRKLGRHGISR